MAYGHAERNLAAVRRLEAETQELLSNLPPSRPWAVALAATDRKGELTTPRRVSAWRSGPRP
jgi:hypothetical protein